MKKILITLLLVSVTLACALLMTSCGPTTADELIYKVNSKMDSTKSVEIESESNIEFTYEGASVKAEIDGEMIISGIGKENKYYYLEENSTKLTSEIAGEVTTKESSELQCYYNENMMLMTKDGSKTKKLYSNISYDDFIAFKSDMLDENDYDIFNCKNKSFT